MNETLRAEYWLKCWIAVANSDNCVRKLSCDEWADHMLAEYDKRFPQIVPAEAERNKEEEIK